MELSGIWEGRLIDATGLGARVALDLDVTDDRARGSFEMRFDPPDDGCGQDRPQIAQRGEVSGRVEGDGRHLTLHYEVELEDGPVVVDFDGRATEADPHARLAIYGPYTIRDGGRSLTMQAGSGVLWRFAGAGKRAA